MCLALEPEAAPLQSLNAFVMELQVRDRVRLGAEKTWRYFRRGPRGTNRDH